MNRKEISVVLYIKMKRVNCYVNDRHMWASFVFFFETKCNVFPGSAMPPPPPSPSEQNVNFENAKTCMQIPLLSAICLGWQFIIAGTGNVSAGKILSDCEKLWAARQTTASSLRKSKWRLTHARVTRWLGTLVLCLGLERQCFSPFRENEYFRESKYLCEILANKYCRKSLPKSYVFKTFGHLLLKCL